MSDWRRIAEDFEEKANVAQMWLDAAIELLRLAVGRGFDVRGEHGDLIAGFLERYDNDEGR